MNLNPERKITKVFGRQPLRYMQDGHGFNAAGDYLGRFDAQGEPVAQEPQRVEAPNATSGAEIGEDPDTSGASEGDQVQNGNNSGGDGEDANSQQPDVQVATADTENQEGDDTTSPPVDVDALSKQFMEKSLKELRTLGGKAGIKGASAMDKPALAEELAKIELGSESA